MDVTQVGEYPHRQLLGLDDALRPGLVVAAGLQDALEVHAPLEPAHRVDRRLVDAVRPAAAAEDEHRRLALGQREGLEAQVAIPPQDVAADRVPGHLEVVLAAEVGARLGERQMHLVGHPRQPAVGQPRDAVLLLEQQRAAQHPGGQRHRSAHVAAGAEHGIRALGRHHPQRLEQADHVGQHRTRPAPPGAARESPGHDGAQAEPALGHGLGLEPAAAAHEHHLGARPQAHQLLGHGDARIDVPSGPAAGDHDLHDASLKRWRASASRSSFPADTR